MNVCKASGSFTISYVIFPSKASNITLSGSFSGKVLRVFLTSSRALGDILSIFPFAVGVILTKEGGFLPLRWSLRVGLMSSNLAVSVLISIWVVGGRGLVIFFLTKYLALVVQGNPTILPSGVLRSTAISLPLVFLAHSWGLIFSITPVYSLPRHVVLT